MNLPCVLIYSVCKEYCTGFKFCCELVSSMGIPLVFHAGISVIHHKVIYDCYHNYWNDLINDVQTYIFGISNVFKFLICVCHNVKNAVTVVIAVTKQWCGNESDAVLVMPKYQSKVLDIPWYGLNRGFFYTLTTREISVHLFWKPLQRGRCGTMRPCFYTVCCVQ